MKTAAILCLLLALASPSRTQTFTEGYASRLQTLPNGSGASVVLANGKGIVFFTGSKLVFRNASRQKILLSFATPVFGSFTIQIGQDDLLFGESKTHGVWKVAILAKRAPIKLATIPFNFAATLLGRGQALISAKTGGFAAKTNQLFALDLNNGATDLIADLPGASGPVALDAKGNLYYATASLQFPPPPGATELLRFTAAQVRGAFGKSNLTLKDARVLFKGLDSASALALDGDDDAFLIDFRNGHLLELDDINGQSPAKKILGDYTRASLSAATLQFLPKAGPGSFEPFQPAGASLIVLESRFAGISRLRRLTAKRPLISSSVTGTIPRGAFTLTTRGAAAGGTGLLALRAGVAGNEVAHRLGGFEQILLFDRGLLTPLATIPIVLDANGQNMLRGFNPGLGRLMHFTFQTAFFDAKRRVLGSSAPRTIAFR